MIVITLNISTSSNVSSSVVLVSLGSTITFWTVPRSTKKEGRAVHSVYSTTDSLNNLEEDTELKEND
jgi:hypothetical protein